MLENGAKREKDSGVLFSLFSRWLGQFISLKGKIIIIIKEKRTERQGQQTLERVKEKEPGSLPSSAWPFRVLHPWCTSLPGAAIASS
jgi:hypothetical protein